MVPLSYRSVTIVYYTILYYPTLYYSTVSALSFEVRLVFLSPPWATDWTIIERKCGHVYGALNFTLSNKSLPEVGFDPGCPRWRDFLRQNRDEKNLPVYKLYSSIILLLYYTIVLLINTVTLIVIVLPHPIMARGRRPGRGNETDVE